MTKLRAFGSIAVLGLTLLVVSGCKAGEESGSAYVKPNSAQANRYKQGNTGAPPGGQPAASAANN